MRNDNSKKDISPEFLRLYAAEARRELARRHLLDFTRYTFPNYRAGWFHKALFTRLELFFENVKAGLRPRLMIFAPPRHGKSEALIRFTAWAHGRNPDLHVIASSYSSDLAERNSRFVQGVLLDEFFAKLYPDLKMGQHRGDLWTIAGHRGIYRAAGVGGGITGMGADILIIDDPVKDQMEADSPTTQESVWDWYNSTAITRLSPGGGIILIQTRWNELDLGGRLLLARGQGGDEWEVFQCPAIAEEDEPVRRCGEALDEDRWPLETLQLIRDDLIRKEKGHIWLALYQQRPQPTEGRGVFGEETLKRLRSLIIRPRRGELQELNLPDPFKDIESGRLRVWEKPRPGFWYTAGFDTSKGVDGGDFDSLSILRGNIEDDVAAFLHINPQVTIGQVHKPAFVAEWHGLEALGRFARAIQQVCLWYNWAEILGESNTFGTGVLDYLYDDLKYPRLLHNISDGKVTQVMDRKNLGFNTDGESKPILIDDLGEALREDRITEPGEEAIFEYSKFINRNTKLGAAHGFHDDRVISRALAWRAYIKLAKKLWPGNLVKTGKKIRPVGLETKYS